MQTCEVDGVRYVSQPEIVTEGNSCTGCAADGNGDLCQKLPECGRSEIIWVRAIGQKPHRLGGPLPVGQSVPDVKPTNPKEAIGDTKLPLALIPDTALMYLSTAFFEGASKYGSYNWRAAGVRAATYKSACERHIKKWWNGENCDPKTKVHHLANAMACLAIILDAEVVGKLNDDRPPKADMNALIEDLEATLAHLRQMNGHLNPHHHTEADNA